jgi:hypothetical protein
MQRRLVAWRAGGESINSLILQGGELQQTRARQLMCTGLCLAKGIHGSCCEPIALMRLPKSSRSRLKIAPAY